MQSWTKQTSPVLQPGAYLAHPVGRAQAGGFSLGYWADNGSEPKGPHGHADAHFMLITSGRYETGACGEAGDGAPLLIFNPPQTHHDDRFDGGGAFFTITVPESCWRSIDARRAPAGPARVAQPRARLLMRRVLREAADWSADSSPVAEALCWELLGQFEADEDAGSHPPAWLARACASLTDDYASHVDLAALSRALGIHPVHLTRSFRRHLRCTPGEYLRSQRLDRAAQLLTCGRKPIAEIAAQTGFADQSHLNRHFARAYGISPARYRRMTT